MTDAEFEYELVEALNMLLEDERASVEMEVALASGATEYSERGALSAMGADDIRFCEQLRTEMEQAGLAVTPQINGVVFQVIGAERYDDRLRAFAHHQRIVAERARELQESNLEGALREALEGISESHVRHADWTENRANAFAATRSLEFGPTGRITAGRAAGASAAEDAALAEDLAAQADAALTERPESARDTHGAEDAPGETPDETQSDAAASDAALANLVADGDEGDEQGPLASAPDTSDIAAPDEAPAPSEAKASARPRARSASTTTRKSATTRASATRKPATTRTTRASGGAKSGAKSNTTASATRRTRRAPAHGAADDTSDPSADA